MIWFAVETWPFGAALVLMLALLILEGGALLFAASPSEWLDAAIPDGVDNALGWLHLGKVPFLVLLGIFLAGFALAGYAVQSVSQSLFGLLLPAWVASLPALLVAVACLNLVGGLLARLMPGDESSAVSAQSLIGRAGFVTQGVAREGLSAEAKVRDHLGRAHYVMVEPDINGQEFAQGAAVLLVKKVGAHYRAIANPHPDLL